ncbi:MAG TPA: ABC transporter permease, partial [Puia sp.]|nr:ABC transporter permease [Puia sp.]
MYKLWATIVKDFRLLGRDRVGLIMMFIMPILLVIVITSVQNSTFELVNDNKITLIVYNKDTATQGRNLIQTIEKIGMFKMLFLPGKPEEKAIPQLMHAKDALVALEIPENFSSLIETKAKDIAGRSLKDFGLEGDTERLALPHVNPLILYYHPVLQQSFRQSINGALESALQVIEGDEIVRNLYSALHEKQIPASLENDILHSKVPITEIPVSRGG